MALSGLLTKLVLFIMLFVYTSVQSLETGYEYKGKNIENDELYKDLKCGYLFGGYTHMRLARILLENQNTDLQMLLGPISSMNHIVRSQIISLFGLKGIRIGAMWILYLFTSLITDFNQEIRNKMEGHLKVIESLVYVIAKLHEDLAGCRKGNTFDTYDIVLARQTFDFYTYTKYILPIHLDEARDLLRKNDKNSDSVLKIKLEISLKMNWLLLRNLGVFNELKVDLQNIYNLRIKWHNTSAILIWTWQNARALDWKNTNLQHIKSYYQACYDFLKIIMFRLTLKHMAYLRSFIGKLDLYKVYVQQWYNIVVQFGTILNLSGDLNVTSLLNCLRNLINGVEKIDSVVSYIVSILATLCQRFGCVACNPFVIDNQEFKIKYKSLTEEEIKSLQITVHSVGIECNSLVNANTFLSHLKLAFHYVNFSAIRSLTEYINEINPTLRRVERSENNIVDSENVHVNISDFE